MGTVNLGKLRLAASLVTNDFEIAELEAIVRTEPGMAYQLLQLASIGSREGMRREIRTLRDALIFVGFRKVQNWIALLLLGPAGQISEHQLATALARARMCEVLATDLGQGQAALGFTAGILSAFEILLGLPAEEIRDALPLDDMLREAAFGDSTPIGRIVRDVIAYQAGNTSGLRLSRVTDEAIDLASIRALTWAVAANRTMSTAVAA